MPFPKTPLPGGRVPTGHQPGSANASTQTTAQRLQDFLPLKIRERKNGELSSPQRAPRQSLPILRGGKIEHKVQLDNIVLQHGHTCKPTALATVDWYHATRQGVGNIPLRKNGHHNYENQLNLFARATQYTASSNLSANAPAPAATSIRQISKAKGSLQGEVLQAATLEKMARDMGYSVDTVAPRNVDDFAMTVSRQLALGNPLVACFAVSLGAPGDAEVGLPSLTRPENEHACLIVGINKKTQTIDITHWGQTYLNVPIKNFHTSMKILPDTRDPETYSRVINPAAPSQYKKYDLIKTGTESHVDPTSQRTTEAPVSEGFKNRLFVLQPDLSNPRWSALQNTRNP